MTQTYVLVHGAWHGAWCWDKFIRTLEQAGHEAVALDLPAHGWDRTPVQGLTRQHYVERVSPDGTMSNVNLDKVKEIFYADCSDLDIERAKELLGPEPLGPRAEHVRITDQRFGRVPRVYIECLQDNAIRPSFQKNMYTATPCKKVYSMNTSHSPFLSAPAELAGILADV